MAAMVFIIKYLSILAFAEVPNLQLMFDLVSVRAFSRFLALLYCDISDL